MAANETDVEAGEVNAPEDSDLHTLDILNMDALFKKYDENGTCVSIQNVLQCALKCG